MGWSLVRMMKNSIREEERTFLGKILQHPPSAVGGGWGVEVIEFVSMSYLIFKSTSNLPSANSISESKAHRPIGWLDG